MNSIHVLPDEEFDINRLRRESHLVRLHVGLSYCPFPTIMIRTVRGRSKFLPMSVGVTLSESPLAVQQGVEGIRRCLNQIREGPLQGHFRRRGLIGDAAPQFTAAYEAVGNCRSALDSVVQNRAQSS